MGHVMSAESARRVITAAVAAGVDATVGGGWAIDALLGRQTRPHADLDLWLPAEHLEPLIPVAVELGIDRLFPWGGDRPWVFVLHDGHELRVDLHMYESLGDGFLHYGSVLGGFRVPEAVLRGRGTIGGQAVTCETPEWALRCKTGYTPRQEDLLDIEVLCAAFDLPHPERHR